MARRFSTEITTGWAQTRAFDYLVDFRNLVDWHPAVQRCELLTVDPQVRNARYLVGATIGGRDIKAEIVVVELERPSLIVASAHNRAARTMDRFELAPAPERRTSVAYRSELRLMTPLRVIGPLMVPGLTGAWGSAMAQLERVIGEAGAASSPKGEPTAPVRRPEGSADE